MLTLRSRLVPAALATILPVALTVGYVQAPGTAAAHEQGLALDLVLLLAIATAVNIVVLQPVAALRIFAKEGEGPGAPPAALDGDLRCSDDRYRLLFEEHPQPMWVFDRRTLEFIEVNEAAIRRYGYSRSEFLSMRVTDIRPAEDVARLRALLAGRGPEWSHSGTWKHLLKSGDSIDVDVASHAVRLGGRDAQLVTAYDVTARVRAEGERRTLEEQLRQSQKMEAIGQFAGGVAHDFNNLLMAIHGFATFIADSLPEGDERHADVQQIQSAADRAAIMTRQLLAFSRKQILSLKVLHVGDVATELTPMLRRLLGEAIDLETIAGDRALVKADPCQLQQVVLNLAVNARDAMEGRGKLTIETADMVLDEAFARKHTGITPGPHVMLAVTDTGHGMSPDTLKRMFEPFFTTKPTGQGTGLGLATVYGIVKQSGGTIWVYSEIGRGTTFKIYLPVTSDCEESPREAVSHETPRGTETVLLVEDDDRVRDLVHRLLSRQGYAVHAVSDATRAIEYAEQNRSTIDLVFTDIVLPDMTGPTLAERVMQVHPKTRVLYMSGYTDQAIVRHGVLGPGMPFLQKPFSTDALARKVRAVLDAARPQ